MRLCFIVSLVFFLFVSNVSATHNVTLISPSNASSCILGSIVEFKFHIDEDVAGCKLYHNNSGSWVVDYHESTTVSEGTHTYNSTELDPNTFIWNIMCYDNAPYHEVWGSSGNFTATVTDAPYCAVLSETECPVDPNIGSEGIFKTRLGNTKGFWLENQDCSVWIEDAVGIVKKYPSMIYQQPVKEIVDSEGNLMNIVSPLFPVTDSQGYYVFPFEIASSWAWVGDEFTIYAVCNGQIASCDFNVSSGRLPDVENYEQTLKKGGGVVFMGLILLALIILFIKKLKGVL